MKIENVMRKLRILKVVNVECSYFRETSKLALLYSRAKYVLQSVNRYIQTVEIEKTLFE